MSELYKPLPDNLRLGFSEIHDIGLFAKEKIPKGTNFGMSHIQVSNTIVRTPLGGFINHSDTPNSYLVVSQEGDDYLIYNILTARKILKNEEILIDYEV